MGGMVSSPVDSSTQDEMQQLIKSVLATFTLQYTKEYALALVQQIKEETENVPEKWELTERPSKDRTFKSGWLVKEGGFKKSWKKRFFVVRPNYTIDYYASEEEANKENGKKKGSISPAGYYVDTDVNNGTLIRLKNLAEKFGMDMSQLPKPKEYPPYTLELHHSTRRCWYIQAANEQEYKEWADEFRTCCRWAWGLKKDEYCHKRAFPIAIRKTRWSLGRWGYSSWGGTEEQCIADIISDEIEYTFMSKILAKVQGPWIVRNKIRKQLYKTIDSAVNAAVTPAWAAMDKAVEELRPKLEPKIREGVQPIFEKQQELMDKLKDSAMNIINPLLDEHVLPHLGKIVAIIKAPVIDAFQEANRLFTVEVDKFDLKVGSDKQNFSELDWLPYSWRLWDATRKLDELYEPLWALRLVFSDIYPWSSIWKGQDRIRKITDNAVYTYEQRILEEISKSNENPKEDVKNEIIEKFRSDADQATMNYYSEILKTIVMPPFNKVVIPACQSVIEPLASMIPEPLQQFIDPNQMFEDLINNIIDECIQRVLTADGSN